LTLKEIAEQAGVHISTVSRILNSDDESFGSAEVRARVWAIVREAGYVPNPNARALRQNQSPSFRVGTLVCVFGAGSSQTDDPFYAQVAQAAGQRALSLGYAVQDSLYAPEIAGAKTDSEKAPATGAIVCGSLEKPEISGIIENRYSAIVFVGRAPLDTAWDQVICDSYEAARTALHHLMNYGHTRIAYVGETGSEPRYRAYEDMLNENSLKLERGLIAKCAHNSLAGSYAGADILLRQTEVLPMPTAVFCASDSAAIAVMRRCKEAKIKIPHQLSVVGMDNIEQSGYVSPMLTTVAMPAVEMGNVAVQLLLSRINKLHKLPQKVYLPSRLIIRESVENLNERMYI
jgi:DNA-binding LacI/PurR family transcriptional regulator